MRIKNGIVTCPVCGKEFLHNPQSIYKLSRGKGVKYYCSYTCWRKQEEIDRRIICLCQN